MNETKFKAFSNELFVLLDKYDIETFDVDERDLISYISIDICRKLSTTVEEHSTPWIHDSGVFYE